ncbi:MAG: PKD domain-containing protein [Candidatus Micrarchaeota archaeon]|nr:PKD domain-containing protein [Candidatus Micrarchaeota archaeon]
MRAARGAVLLAILAFAALTISVFPQSAPSAPTISLNPTNPNLGTVSLTGTITLSQGTTLSQVTVDWGDNSNNGVAQSINPPSTSLSVSHPYSQPGPYYIIVTAIATDSKGNTYTGSAETLVDIVQTQSSGVAAQPAASAGVHCITNNGDVTAIGPCIADSFPLSILGLTLSLALVAVAYMAGEIIELGGLKGWYKKELWETGKSALIIAIIFSSMVLASGVATAVAGNAAAFQYGSQQSAGSSIVSNLDSLYATAATSYIQPQLLSSYGAFATNLGLSMGVATLGSITLSLWAPVPIYVGCVCFGSDSNIYTSGYLNPAATTSSFLKNVMSLIIIPVMLIFQFQNDLLPLIVTIGFAVFLPLGIILRAFPFLRPLGGTMIAIAIGASLVYPALLVGFNLPISNYFTAATGYGAAPAPTTCNESGISGVACIFITGAQNFVADLSPGAPILAATLGASNVYNFKSSQSLPILYNNAFDTGFSDSINSVFPDLNLVITSSINEILQFILFVFDLVIGLVTVGAISTALGGIDLSKRRGIGKFKLF